MFTRKQIQNTGFRFLVVAGLLTGTGVILPSPLFAQLDDPNLVPAPAARRDRAATDLKAHGVGTSTQELVGLLEDGLSKTTGLPEQPAEKCQLAVDAMAKLAAQKSSEAVPILSRIASMDLPRGVATLLELDLARTTPQEREKFRQQAMRLLQYNAANALSVIGDSSATNVLRTIFTREGDPGARIQYALCMASLGDISGVDYLVQLIMQENRRESAAAAKAFAIITGKDFGYTENTPIRARRSRAKQYNEWWAANKRAFKVSREDVMERRANPDANHRPFEPRSTRDLLKLTANYFDFNNTHKSADARKVLGDAGPAINPDLERIAQDPMEDLDVRLEAMNWYFEANRSRARALFKRLRKDENREVADKADTLLDQIEDESKDPVPTTRIR